VKKVSRATPTSMRLPGSHPMSRKARGIAIMPAPVMTCEDKGTAGHDGCTPASSCTPSRSTKYLFWVTLCCKAPKRPFKEIM
jgi:hypothetical protein